MEKAEGKRRGKKRDMAENENSSQHELSGRKRRSEEMLAQDEPPKRARTSPDGDDKRGIERSADGGGTPGPCAPALIQLRQPLPIAVPPRRRRRRRKDKAETAGEEVRTASYPLALVVDIRVLDSVGRSVYIKRARQHRKRRRRRAMASPSWLLLG